MFVGLSSGNIVPHTGKKKISLVHDSESDSESLNDLDFIYVLKFSKILSHFGISFVL